MFLRSSTVTLTTPFLASKQLAPKTLQLFFAVDFAIRNNSRLLQLYYTLDT